MTIGEVIEVQDEALTGWLETAGAEDDDVWHEVLDRIYSALHNFVRGLPLEVEVPPELGEDIETVKAYAAERDALKA